MIQSNSGFCLLPVHNTSTFLSVISMITAVAFIKRDSTGRRKRAGIAYSSSLYTGYTRGNTAHCSPTEVWNNSFIQSNMLVSDLRVEKAAFLRPEICEFCKATTKLDAKCWAFTFLNLGTSSRNNRKRVVCQQAGEPGTTLLRRKEPRRRQHSRRQEHHSRNQAKPLHSQHIQQEPNTLNLTASFAFEDIYGHACVVCHGWFFIKLSRSDNT